MHELERDVAQWRRSLLAGGWVRTWQADELEDHLRTHYALAVDEGVSPSAAWISAVQRTGNAQTLNQEFKKHQAMNPHSKLCGLVITGAALIFVLERSSGGIASFLFLPAALALWALVGGGLVASFGPRRTLDAFRASCVSSTLLEPEDVAAFSDVFRRGYRLSWMSGVILSIMGIIHCLAHLPDPLMLGEGIATATTSLLYGALLAEVGFANGRQWLENRLAAAS